MRINHFSIFFLSLLPLIVTSPTGVASEPALSDIELLSKIEKDSLQYFIRMSDKMTGLTRDSSRAGSPASIAATGFALAAVAIGASRGWIDSDQASDQLGKTLKTLLTKAQHERGFFYHFLDSRTGRRVWGSEASSIDTALLVAGALLAGRYYPGTEIDRMAQDIYRRVDWKWMMNHSDLVCMGWKPESGFFPYYWDSYNEHLIIQALAIGSPTHPIPPGSWNSWFRNEDEYNGKKIIYSHSGSLFTYQYAQAFIDFKHLNDRGINYAENSRNAATSNREYTLSFRDQFKGYSESSWGVSASLGPGGYKAYGAKPGLGLHDGTIAPYAAIASIVFTPAESTAAARFFFEKYESFLYGIFGFKDAFNLNKNWWAYEYLGIDQGITVLMLENFLNRGAVWERFMKLEPVERWMALCGLKEISA